MDNKLSEETHVYCTDCKHFLIEYCESIDDYLINCIYTDKCCFEDIEDSKPYSERPNYEVKNEATSMY